MTCKDFEKRIALAACGDLPSPEAEALRAHVESCAACRELEREVADLHLALTGAGVEPDEFALARVRRGVLAEVTAPRQGLRIWRWVAGGALAAAVLAIIALVALRPVEPPAIAARLAVPPPPAIAPPAPAPAPPQVAAVRRRARHARSRVAPAKPQEELVVRLATSDPDVVIYWIVEGKGD